ncbi:MAG: type II CAAX prenyl endopeptidase Rce1 family protein [Rubrobacteraceae bacterium]
MEREFSQLARRGRTSPRRYLVSALILVIIWFGSGYLFLEIPILIAGADGDPGTYLDGETGELVGINPLVDYAAVLLSFVVVLAGVYLVVRFIHQRPFLSLVTPGPGVNWRRMAQGFGLWLAVVAVASLAGYLLDPARYTLDFEPGSFLVLLLVAGMLVPIQTSTEELLFDGFVLQGFGLFLRNIFLLAAVMGLVFIPGHLGGRESLGDFLGAGGYYFVFGGFFALITLLDNGLELALGAHAANNLFIDLLFDYETYWISLPAVFTVSDQEPGLVVYDVLSFLIMAAVFYLLAFRLFRKPSKPGRGSK